jgi:DcaP outer membrane protein
MRSNFWTNRITIGITTLLLFPFSTIWTGQVRAQSQDRKQEIQELKDKLQQLDQTMGEVKARISALESSQPTAPTAAPTVTTTIVARAPEEAEPVGEKTFEIYGHTQLDSGYNFQQIDPNWFDVVRPTKLPAYKNEFGPDGNVFFSVRQTRFGVKTETPTSLGALKTWFEFELFGTGVDQGQTTFRLRQAYGELGKFGAGQTWSPFMDIDVFPNSLEYWGPSGMVFFRNIQFRWMPIKGDSRVIIAAERPGASGDGGTYSDRIELQDVKPQFNLPDLSIQGRLARHWGYIQGATIFRKISWADLSPTPAQNLSRTVLGWGVNVSSNLKLGEKSTARMQVIYGRGVENYMNDAPADVAIRTSTNTTAPVKGVPLPVLGVVSFLDHNWNKKFSTAAGYSLVNISNTNGQAADSFHQGHYALTNLLYYPVKNVMVGGEFQFGRRVNYLDGFNTNDYRVQVSFKYNFSKMLTY